MHRSFVPSSRAIVIILYKKGGIGSKKARSTLFIASIYEDTFPSLYRCQWTRCRKRQCSKRIVCVSFINRPIIEQAVDTLHRSSASPASASAASTKPTRPIPKISDPASLVIPFIGTTNGGHVFPGKSTYADVLLIVVQCWYIYSSGATLPHGMIKAGMDTDSPGNVKFSNPNNPMGNTDTNHLLIKARWVRWRPHLQRNRFLPIAW